MITNEIHGAEGKIDLPMNRLDFIVASVWQQRPDMFV